MNIFILGTGRSGTTALSKACKFITNYTAGHETNAGKLGNNRLEYSPWHIESDNRLSWMLGRLYKKYGSDAIYVHLKRDPILVQNSFLGRWVQPISLVRSFCSGILQISNYSKLDTRRAATRDMIETIKSNIDVFFEGKCELVEINIENIEEDFSQFWHQIKAEGDLDAALLSFRQKENKSKWYNKL